jgi:hypothetical protein
VGTGFDAASAGWLLIVAFQWLLRACGWLPGLHVMPIQRRARRDGPPELGHGGEGALRLRMADAGRRCSPDGAPCCAKFGLFTGLPNAFHPPAAHRLLLCWALLSLIPRHLAPVRQPRDRISYQVIALPDKSPRSPSSRDSVELPA